MPITEHTLQHITDRPSLYAFLRNALGWPVDLEDTFMYGGPQLDGAVAARVEVGQIVPFSAGDPFTIFLAEFETPLRRTDLREILRRVREDIRTRAKYEGRTLEEIVFVCATEGYKGLRFAHFEAREKGTPRLRVFGYDRGQVDGTRTLRDFNLPALTMPAENVLGEPDWAEGRHRWMSAWDVERVTDAFFKRYKEVFHAAQTHMEAIAGEDARLCAQRLFNRLLFLRFLEKKGWLTFHGRPDYLRALWEDYQAKRPDGGTNFYTSRLKPLFFAALNQPHVRDGHGDTWLSGIIGDVSYLNGGLFDDAEDKAEAECHPGLLIRDEALGPVVTDFFYHYNFTVTESTPDDVEVAVDPEMLGKVFEELVTGRHESGSYYTPRGIVQFMCREALKGYLTPPELGAGGPPSPADIAALVDERNADGISKKQAADLITKLKAVKVVDPAGGSGAYVLGMLHELFDLIGLLEVRADPMTPQGKYRRKLEIIQNSLYAVDMDGFAVNIARLRLWLSLAVEFEGDTPEPLPNLDFKVEVGDSLAAPSPQASLTADMFRQQYLREYETKKRDFGDPYYTGPISKPELKAQINTLRADIAIWTHAGNAVAGFDWRVEFCEVFQPTEPVADIGGAMNFGGTLTEPPAPGGFDIVLANPPYVRQELIKAQKPTLKAVYPEVYSGTADLYCYFYARAVQLLKAGGMLSFISPNKWFRAGYGANLRRHIADTCRVVSIMDFGELPVFQSAATFPMVFVAQKAPSTPPESGAGGRSGPTFTQIKSLNAPYPDVLAFQTRDGHQLPPAAIAGADWTLTDTISADRLRRMEKAGIPLRLFAECRMFNGVKTGMNTAFVISSSTRDNLIKQEISCSRMIHPFLEGDDIRKWRVKHQDSSLLYVRWSDKISTNSPIIKHLSRYKEGLQNRDGVKNGGICPWFALSRPRPESYTLFLQDKILYPLIAMEPRFTLDRAKTIPNNSVYCLSTNCNLYVLAILNSPSAWDYLKSKCAVLGDQDKKGRLQLTTAVLENLPIPDASPVDRAAIAALVQKCLDAKGAGCEAWEQEINERVAALYGL